MSKKQEQTELIPMAIVEHRTAIARMMQLELAVEKDRLSLEEKKRNICRIDLALSEFDGLLSEFVTMLKTIPDKMQSICPAMNPKQYKEVQNFINNQLERLSQKRLYLAIESTAEEKQAASEVTRKSVRKAAKIKGNEQ